MGLIWSESGQQDVVKFHSYGAQVCNIFSLSYFCEVFGVHYFPTIQHDGSNVLIQKQHNLQAMI